MKLFYSPYSPFVRKVLVVAHELDLVDKIELLDSNVWPTRPDDSVIPHNALSQVPTLVLDDGSALADSRVICEYLNEEAKGALFPQQAPLRWQALTLQAQADGLLNAALLARYERVARAEQFQWNDWVEAQLGKVNRVLNALEADHARKLEVFHIGAISVACALGYLDLRFSDLAWRDSAPTLAKWFESVSKRDSLQLTTPPAP